MIHIKNMPAGFHQIQRHDGIFQDQVLDAYRGAIWNITTIRQEICCVSTEPADCPV